jgi:pullulanase
MNVNRLKVAALTVATTTIISGCGPSNEKTLNEVSNGPVLAPQLVCKAPDTIAVDSFGKPILDGSGQQSCERVELTCTGQVYDAVTHTCQTSGRHPNAPLETANAIPPEGFATVFYYNDAFTADDVDSGWVIHAWNNRACDAYDPSYYEPGVENDYSQNDYWDTDWLVGISPDGFDENYGLYWVIKLLPEHSDCANFIVHRGDERGHDGDLKALISNDSNSRLFNEDRMSYVAAGITTPDTGASPFPYYSEPGDPGQTLREVNTDQSAHWLDLSTFLFPDPDATSVRLYADKGADRGDGNPPATATFFPGEGYRGVPYIEFFRDTSGLSDEQSAKALRVANMPVFVAESGLDPELAKDMLRARLVAISYDDEGVMKDGYLVQTAKVLDALYTAGEDDANEADLGIIYQDGQITAKVWAPTAVSVSLNTYADKDASGQYAETSSTLMTRNNNTGIWSYTGSLAELDRKLFRYEIDVYHHQNDQIERVHVIDPYAVSVTTNGRYARFVDLNDADLMPEGWETHNIPTVANPEDIVVYEGHIRNFSIFDESTTPENRGKYLAFSEQNTAPTNHLRDLADAGLTHFQILPANDIATINEDLAERVDVFDTIGDLCAIRTEAEICSIADADEVILTVLENLDPLDEKGRNLINELKGLDGSNWGYDPYIFNAPEGSYSSNPEDTSRIIEMRSMVMGLHDIGLRASLDVVYNHTSTSGLWDNSVFDKIVPGYYQRRDTVTGNVLGETCCQDTTGEYAMFSKFIVDSVYSWAKYFKFDAFRFDLMVFIPKDTMLEARAKVQSIDPDTYFYGEGWDFGAIRSFGASQNNMAGTELGTFSDRQREGVRSASLFKADGNRNDVDIIRMGLAGTLTDYVMQANGGSFGPLSSYSPSAYGIKPADIVNYVDKHDNETLWDQLQYNLPADFSVDDRVRIHGVATSFPLLSQGLPFTQMGSDLLRSKSMDRNTYDSGDWHNRVDFTMQTNNWNVGLPIEVSNREFALELAQNPNIPVTPMHIMHSAAIYQDLLKIRKSSNLFRLTEAEYIIDRVGFHNTGQNQTHGLIVMSIDDGMGCINGTKDFDGNCDAITDMRMDLDPNFDAIVVLFNGTQTEQMHAIPSAMGFELHDVQAASQDTELTRASFMQDGNNGVFTVPALTTAVFVKKQAGAQGLGLNAFATVGEPEIPPFNATTVYLRGGMNDWGTTTPFEFVGSGTYEVSLDLEPGTYAFKVASEDWSAINIGGGEVELDTPTTIGTSGGDMSVVITDANNYTFSVDASLPATPILTIAASVEKPVYGETTIYIRGSINANGGWNLEDPMLFVGNSTYVTNINITAGNHEFKVASEDWSTVNVGVDSGAAELGVPLVLDGGGNIGINIENDGDYLFTVDASLPSQPIVTVTLDDTTYPDKQLYVRGFNGDWGTTNPMQYFGNGYYSVDLQANGDSQFKVAEEDWSTVNYGTSDPIQFGKTFDLIWGGDSPNTPLNSVGESELRFLFKVIDDENHEATITVFDLETYF